MGLKKLIKKVTKPISKVLDKIVPNEIKPLLPYAAAFAPYLLPAGVAGQGLLGTMAGRAMLTGGLNVGAQLSQEGSEGEFSGLSAILAALQGAGTAPGAGDTLRGMTTRGGLEGVDSGLAKGVMENRGIMAKGTDALLNLGAKGADTLGGFANTLQNNPFSMAGLKAASVPASLATGDLAMAQARKAMQEWEEGEALRMAQQGADNEAYDSARRSAVIASLQAYGYLEDDINETLSQLGMQLLASGGRVGFEHGGSGFDGLISAVVKTDENDMKMANLIPQELKLGLEEEFEIIFKRPPANDEELFRFYYDKEEWKGPGDVKMIEGESEEVMAADGGRIGLREGGGLLSQILAPQAVQTTAYTSTQNAPMLGNFNPGLGGRMPVFPRLNQLEQGVNRAEGSLNRIRNRLGNDPQTQLHSFGRPSYGIQPLLGGLQPLHMLNLNRGAGLSQLQGGQDQQFLPDAQGQGSYEKGGSVLPQGMEMDYRGGGMIPMGTRERADDVPARVSKNEFVMTADAVRAAGGGSVNKGAQRMYNLMHNLEARA